MDVSGATDRVVSLYHNGDAFVDETGEPHSAWVVISVGTFVDSHYCALFDNAAAARKFYDAEVELNEEWVEAMLE